MSEIINIHELENRYAQYEEKRNAQREKQKQTAIENIKNYTSTERFYYIINQINNSINRHTMTKKNDRYCRFEIEKSKAFYFGGNHNEEKMQQNIQLKILKKYIKDHGYIGIKEIENRLNYMVFKLRWKNKRK